MNVKEHGEGSLAECRGLGEAGVSDNEHRQTDSLDTGRDTRYSDGEGNLDRWGGDRINS